MRTSPSLFIRLPSSLFLQPKPTSTWLPLPFLFLAWRIQILMFHIVSSSAIADLVSDLSMVLVAHRQQIPNFETKVVQSDVVGNRVLLSRDLRFGFLPVL